MKKNYETDLWIVGIVKQPISKFIKKPNKKEIMPYLKSFNKRLLMDTNSKLIIFGPQQIEIDLNNLPNKIQLYRFFESFINDYSEEKIYA